MAKIVQSVEPNIADIANGWLKSYDLDYKLEQESLNAEIDQALNDYYTKNGGVGGNRPDAKLLLRDSALHDYPILIEYKGYKDKLIKLDSIGNVDNRKKDGTPNFANINGYAVNGAIHYANALLHYTSYTEIISIGMTGFKDGLGKLQFEIGVYYVSKSNYGIGQKVDDYTDFSFLKHSNFDKFIEKVKQLQITQKEIEKLRERREQEINASLVRLNNFDIQKEHINGKGIQVITSGLANCGILGKTDVAANTFPAGTITVDMFGYSFYRSEEYKMVTHARVFSLCPKFSITDKEGLFISSALRFIRQKFGFDIMCTWEKIKALHISLPTTNEGAIDFDFMDSFIAELEAEGIAELDAYLKTSGLDRYELTKEEETAINNYGSLQWATYNLESLFGKSTRGKRLKSEDRVAGTLPFVTAGEADEGVSAFIGNKVRVFEKNTTTIDMFGSAKYRNYQYGADDHAAVVHTESLPMKAAIFVTSACHKAAHTGRFDYGNNFYAKDADALDIMLPTKNGKPDYPVMETLISAIQKLVIKDVVCLAKMKKAGG